MPGLHAFKLVGMAVGVALFASCRQTQIAPTVHAVTAPVGRRDAQIYYTPVNQILTPAGLQVELPGMRPQVLALSPDGQLLITAGKTHELIVINPLSGTLLQRVPFPSEKDRTPEPDKVSNQILAPDKDAQVSFTGLVFSPDGRRIYMANVNGSIKVFGVGENHRVTGLWSMPLQPFVQGKRKADIPSGLAISHDGRRLYVVLNLSNRLAEMDAATGKLLRLWDVGVAPHDVVLAGNKAYVSNRGGRRPDASSTTGPAGRGTLVRVDPVRHIASEGSVTVIDLDSGNVKTEILAGLHTCGLALSPDGRFICAANSGSDTISVIDTRTDSIVETIWARQNPADLFGAQPNALAFDSSGKTLLVCNGTQNAVAVVDFHPPMSKLTGLIPVGWFPGAVVWDTRRKSLYVANIKGIGSTRKYTPGEKERYNSHQYFGTLSLIRMPKPKELPRLTQTALANLRYPLLEMSRLPPRPGQPPVPVPERVGEPSVFQHVVYIIKENRTYDQVLGDMPEGNGDPALCIFGERISPNHHKLAREFVLLDNTYCSGVLSADGHQWTDSAMANEYLERSFAGFPRSYPDGMGDDEVDALAYSSAGFIWDNALARGKTIRSYGEFAITVKKWRDPQRKGKIKFMDHYREFIEGTSNILVYSRPAIESLRPHLVTNTVGWDMDIPDIFRAAQFIKELKQFEKNGGFPNLTLICLPNDHTSGTAAGAPTPAAQVADNDLALGQIVEAISRSRFWSNTCIFVIEDDPQNGWDHVSGYRTVAFVISPYTKRRATISTQYNQTSILRTIELILGLPPMNQLDATATPMSDCFTNVPDFTPYTCLPNNIPLDQMNPEPRRIADPLLRRHAVTSSKLPLDQVDKCPEDVLNRILWHAMKGPDAPYPAWAVSRFKDD